jgi:hypothetical protein
MPGAVRGPVRLEIAGNAPERARLLLFGNPAFWGLDIR